MEFEKLPKPETPAEPPAPQRKIPKPVSKVLTEKIKSLIFWIGLICAIVSAAAYMIIIIVMTVGFKASPDLSGDIVFAVITAFIGMIISQFLKIQGISFAKNEKEVKEVWERYYTRKSKKRKYRSLKFFWFTSMVTDILIKSLSVVAIFVGTVYVFIRGSGDAMRVLMAIFNLTLFAGFGMMSLTKAYDFTKEQHTAWMLRQIELECAESERGETADEEESTGQEDEETA